MSGLRVDRGPQAQGARHQPRPLRAFRAAPHAFVPGRRPRTTRPDRPCKRFEAAPLREPPKPHSRTPPPKHRPQLLGGFISSFVGGYDALLQIHGNAGPRAALFKLLGGFAGDFEGIWFSA